MGGGLPRKNRRHFASRSFQASRLATCVISWFINQKIRSLLGVVSRVRLTGATCTVRALTGDAAAPALL